MKIKDGYILDTIAGQQVAIALDMADDQFVGMVKLNDVGAFLWQKLQQEVTEDELVMFVTEQYEVDDAKARTDIQKFTTVLKEKGILE